MKEAKNSSLKEKLSTETSNVIVNWKEKFHWLLFNFSIHKRYWERKMLCNVCIHARCGIPLTIHSIRKIKKHCCGVFRYSKLLIQQSIDNLGVECAYRKEIWLIFNVDFSLCNKFYFWFSAIPNVLRLMSIWNEKEEKNTEKCTKISSERRNRRGKRVLFFLTIARFDHVNMNMNVHWIESSESEMGGRKQMECKFFVSR